MKKKTKFKALECIGTIYDQAKRCELKPAFFKQIDNELTQFSKYLNTSKSQSFYTAIIFALNYKGNTVDLSGLVEYFGCNPVKILEDNDDFEVLHSEKIITKKTSGRRVNLTRANDQFTINESLSEAIINDKPMPKLEDEGFKNVIEFLQKVYDLGLQRDEEEISTSDLFRQTKEMVLSHLRFSLIKRVHECNFRIADTTIFLYLIWKTISGNETTYVDRTLKGIFSNPSKRVTYMQDLLLQKNELIKNKWVDLVEAKFLNDTEMKLSDSSQKMLNECDMGMFINKTKKENVILNEQIQKRKLIFNDEEMKQLDLVKRLLHDSNLEKAQLKLESKNLPKGITVLLHGLPGTGKTETVLQLAKETKREILKVDISKSKSMWFGESEKIIKRIFTDYHSFAKTCDRMPILLFNEADAIISKRVDVGNSNVAQTENAIQNIILEELENFEGILMATTNLADNMDSAFDRRFLFKVKFNKPDTSIMTRIWKMKLPNLSDIESKLLASKFEFSGGQIDNIVRKNEINQIIHGGTVCFDNLLEFAKEETILNTNSEIGFKQL